jgi:membrane associated rhomboid family serine protease
MIPTPEINFNRTPVTLIIAAVAAALAVVGLDEGRQLHYYNEFLGILPSVWEGQIWRPFTTCLMHADPIHALFNIYWLVVFGPALENRLGPWRTLGLVVLLGYVSMMPEYVIGSYNRAEPVMIVGLSGIMYGLFGMLWVGRRWRPGFAAVCTNSTVQILSFWLVFCILLTHFGVMNVANIAHGAGLLFGALYGMALFSPRHRRWWILGSIAASLVVLSTLIAAPGHRGYETVQARARAKQLIEQLQRIPPERQRDDR